MKFLRKYIEDKIDIDDNEWERVSSLFTKKTYKKGEEIHSAGEVCQKVYYISSGVARTYIIDTQGRDITWAVHYHKNGYELDPFAGDYVSYVSHTQSDFFCESLSDCVVYISDFAALDKLYESELKWMTLARKISDTQLVTAIQRIKMMHRLTAKEKYELIQQVAPVYIEVLPDYQLASVLGIAPQSLSRIKNQYKGNK